LGREYIFIYCIWYWCSRRIDDFFSWL